MKKLMLLVTAWMISGCASTTLINSSPDGAKVFMNGNLLGTTPYSHKDKKVSGSKTELVLKKEGYEDFKTVLARNERPHGGAIAGGIFFLIPFIWTMQYDKTHTYELKKQP